MIRNVTLKEYFEIKGYGKGKEINISTFAEIVGVSVAYISKLYNNQITTLRGGNCWDKISNYVKKDGYTLVRGDILSLGCNCVSRERDKLTKRVRELESENAFLKAQLNDLREIIRLCEKVTKKGV